MMRLALMQGRLTPPRRQPIQEFPEDWAGEFPVAASLGFDAIEFIFGGTPEQLTAHPLLEPGLEAIRAQVAATGVQVLTVCADHFMEAPLHRGRPAECWARAALLARLVAQAGALGVTDIVLPCVDAATLRDGGEETLLLSALAPILAACAQHRVRIAMELDLPPQGVRALLARCDSPWLCVNYDAGNSAGLGYDPAEEWAAYGARISSVHLKDRRLGGTTVPFGTGDTKFDRLFTAMRAAGYDGLLTIQGARGEDHAATAAAYKAFVEALLKRHGFVAGGTYAR